MTFFPYATPSCHSLDSSVARVGEQLLVPATFGGRGGAGIAVTLWLEKKWGELEAPMVSWTVGTAWWRGCRKERDRSSSGLHGERNPGRIAKGF